MIYNFRFDRDALGEILRRIREENFLSQGWGGFDHNLDISRLSKQQFIQKCRECYNNLETSRIPGNLYHIHNFKDGDILVVPHLPEYGKVSIHIVEGDFPECYDYLENDSFHLNHRIKLKKSYGLDALISINNFDLAPWRRKLQALRLPIVAIEQDEPSFKKIIHRLETEPAKFESPELSGFTVENFKVFQKCEITLAPLTILIGENSSGKSSLLQVLLLLKQTLESLEGSGIVNLNSQYVQFHKFRELVFGMPPLNKEAIIGFELAFNHNKLKFEIGILEKGNQLNLLSAHFNDEKLLDKESSRLFVGDGTLFSLLKSLLQSSKTDEAKLFIDSVITPTLTGIGYLSPVRLPPQRYYNLTGVTPLWIGSKFEYMADFLDKHASVRERVQDWFVRSEMAREVKFKTDPERDQMEIIFAEVKSGLEIDISRLGFGYSQILPIIVGSFSQKKMLIFEAPEIHINPKLHGVMTDLFIEGALSDKQVLVETHSEHVVY